MSGQSDFQYTTILKAANVSLGTQHHFGPNPFSLHSDAMSPESDFVYTTTFIVEVMVTRQRSRVPWAGHWIHGDISSQSDGCCAPEASPKPNFKYIAQYRTEQFVTNLFTGSSEYESKCTTELRWHLCLTHLVNKDYVKVPICLLHVNTAVNSNLVIKHLGEFTLGRIAPTTPVLAIELLTMQRSRARSCLRQERK